ncbi:MAG: histidine--tRNA ligase [Elusimicrobia bacterium]|nr:histidine--tRNA ligase [Elusimicrobiota bacterium]
MLTTVRGFKDILYPQSELFTAIEIAAREIFKIYNYKEIRLPTVEYYELFVKSTGETTDIVEKEMYKFEDQSKRMLALRPEGTPGIVRAYINSNLNLKGENSKFFYIGNMFRAERPQAGRYREFEQIGAEYLGNASPYADAEVIMMLDSFLKKLGIKSYTPEINSIGCTECRKKYRGVLINHLKNIDLCDDCKNRIGRNPLRVLDCKTDRDKLKDIPHIELCTDCRTHYESVKNILTTNNLKFKENYFLVRGLDYYTRTVFEFKTDQLGSQDAVASGGRYDTLVKSMGGPDSPSVGWAAGVERIAMLVEKNDTLIKEKDLFFVVSMDKAYSEYCLKILTELRKNNIRADFSNFSVSIKSQLRSANSNGAKYALIIGDDEYKTNTITLKNLSNGEQKKTNLNEIIQIMH